MALENATKISELVASNPLGSDPLGEGDNHIRILKQVLLNEFYPGSRGKAFSTMVIAIADELLELNDTFNLTADRGNSGWLVITKGVTPLVDLPNGDNIIASTGDLALAFKIIEGSVHDAEARGIFQDGGDYHVKMQAAVDALVAGETLEFRSGTYEGWFNIRTSGVNVVSRGGKVIIKVPDGASHTVPIEGGGNGTGVPIGIDIGNTPMGNSAVAVDNITCTGFEVDGNRANTTTPATDLFGWGVTMTKATGCTIAVRGINCWQGGFGGFINSNENTIDAYAENCGFSAQLPASIDLNSSDNNVVNAISKDCNFGGRIIDNCDGNIFNITIKNPTISGFILTNQLVNEGCFNNQINVSVIGGVTADAMQIGAKCYSNPITLSTKGVGGGALHIVKQASASDNSRGNNIVVNSYESQLYSVKSDGDNNTITMNSTRDGRQGAAGAHHALTCDGDKNKLSLNIVDSGTAQVRGWVMASNATDNEIVSVEYDGLVSPFTDLGTRTKINFGSGFGENIASASNLNIPTRGDMFLVTGTTDISSITAVAKREIKLVFAGILTVFSGVNIKVAGNYVTTAEDTLTLVCDGTNWFEVSRSVNA